MMANKNRPGQGVLFTNNNKTSEKQPDYKGELILDQDYGKGSTIKIAGWRRKTPQNHLISLAVDSYKKDDSQQYPKAVMDDEIPF
jgi:hypothetical protein